MPARQGSRIALPVSARTTEQLTENLGCLDFDLSPEYPTRLDEVSRVSLGYPREFNAIERIKKQIHGETLGLIDKHRET